MSINSNKVKPQYKSVKLVHLLLTLALGGLAPGGAIYSASEEDQTISGGGEGFNGVSRERLCDPNDSKFFLNHEMVDWGRLENKRINPSDYYGRVFEAEFKLLDRDYYAYKTLLKIRGVPSWVSVALSENRIDIVNVDNIADKASYFLEIEAKKLAKKSKDKTALMITASSGNNFNILENDNKLYFSISGENGFGVFAFSGKSFEFLCSNSEIVKQGVGD